MKAFRWAALALVIIGSTALAQVGPGGGSVGPSSPGASGWHTLKQVNVEQTVVTGTTLKTTSYSFIVPGGTLGANGSLKVTPVFRFTGANGTRTVGMDFGGTTFWQTAALGSTNLSLNVFTIAVANRNSTSSQIGGAGIGSNSNVGVSATDAVAAAIDTTANQTITLWITLANGNDTGAVERVLVEYNNDNP